MTTILPLLHLCDSLFPIGGLSHSDGLEGATAAGDVRTADDLRAWIQACLRETLRRSEGPGLRIAWHAFISGDFKAIDRTDEELYVLRPSSTARAASRSMGSRLLRTWLSLHPEAGLSTWLDERKAVGVTLPIAFGLSCARSDIELRQSLEGFIYTRLAAVISSAMRLIAIGQFEAHTLLAEGLAEAPAIVGDILERAAPPALFAPAFDLAAMSQQYVHSRLFRS